MFFRSKMRQVKCPDGSTRQVYRDINDAMPLALRESIRKSQATVQELAGATASLGTEQATSVHSALFALNDKNDSLMMALRAVYLVFCANPCANDRMLAEQVSLLIEQQRMTTDVLIRTRGLIELARLNPQDSNSFIKAYLSIVDMLGTPRVAAPAATLAIRQQRETARSWSAGELGEGEPQNDGPAQIDPAQINPEQINPEQVDPDVSPRDFNAERR